VGGSCAGKLKATGFSDKGADDGPANAPNIGGGCTLRGETVDGEPKGLNECDWVGCWSRMLSGSIFVSFAVILCSERGSE